MDIILSNAGGKPIYEQITGQIKQQIISGTLRAGDALPSMRLLAKELRVSVITTKRAYEDLERDGFIVTVQGRGSFVAETDRAVLEQGHRRQLRQELQGPVEAAKAGGVPLAELQQIVQELYEGYEG